MAQTKEVMFHADGILFGHVFSTPEMRARVSEVAYIEQFMRAEAALARSQAALDIIPEDAAREITATASTDHLDLEILQEKIEELDLFTVALIETWREQIGSNGEYIHFGATSQDIADTAMVLLIREGLELVWNELDTVVDELSELAEEYATTPMIGRTHHVHALPITFGLKAANWLDELDRGMDRLAAAAQRVLVVECFGAVGTLAAHEGRGVEVLERFADELDLDIPNTAWFAARDRFVELMNAFAQIATTAGRIAKQILLLNREEINELSEPIPDAAVGSSTMPHKDNPIRGERSVGLAALIRGHATIMGYLAEGYDERDAGLWYAEFAVLPETFLYLHRLVRNLRNILTDLEVHPAEMRENLGIHGDLIASELVMMRLAKSMGRLQAHAVVHEAAMKSRRTGQDLVDVIVANDRVPPDIPREELISVMEPAAYTGEATDLVQRTLDDVRSA